MKKSMKKGVLIATLAAVLALPTAIGVGASFVRKDEVAQTQVEMVISAATLRQGSTGSEVKEVQRRLKTWGYYNGNVDGVFGAATRAAVIAFQKKNGLTADGIVGKATYAALGINASSGSVTRSTSSRTFSLSA